MRSSPTQRTSESSCGRETCLGTTSCFFPLMTDFAHLPFFLGTFVSLLVVINPVSKVGLFAALMHGADEARRRQVSRRATLTAFALIFGVLVSGNLLLTFFGISSGAMRVAGGFIVTTIGLRILFGADQTEPLVVRTDDPAFFPLATPGIAGPGTLAVVFGFSTQWAELASWTEKAVAFGEMTAAVVFALLVVWSCMRWSAVFVRRASAGSLTIFVKLTGFIMICIGVQFMGSGAMAFWAGS